MAVPGTYSLSSGSGVPGTFSLPGSSFGGGGGKKKNSGFLGDIGHVIDVVTQPVENLGKDVGVAAVGLFPGLYEIGKTAVTNPQDLPKFAKAIVEQYEDYYGHDILQHLYDHPLQPILDGLTLASGGTAGAAKFGQLANVPRLAALAERSTLVTRSPLAVYTGEGPVAARLSSNRPFTKLRQQTINKVQQHLTDFAAAGGTGPRRLLAEKGPLSETKAFGKAIGNDAIQQALKDSTRVVLHEKAFQKLSKPEKVALSMRSLDVHPENLRELWGTASTPGKLGRKTVNGKQLTDKVYDLMITPTPKMQRAEFESRALSSAGAELLKRRNALSEVSEIERPERFKEMIAQHLGHPINTLHDDPWYVPHTIASQYRKGSHPMMQVGGGKAPPKAPKATKQNLGILFREGKLDFENDVLGAEYLRRVKWLKFNQIHESLKDGAIRMSWDELHDLDPSGMPPKGYDFMRQHDQTIPFSIRGEGEHAMYGKAKSLDETEPGTALERYIPDPTDLQRSTLSEGFSTRHIRDAATDENGNYLLIPKATARAATGEFTRMSDFIYNWAHKPLRIWRAALLGLRPAFFVNNMLGNSLMYMMKTGGKGAIRNLYMALRESHPDYVMKRLLKDPATPPDVRLELLERFHPDELTGGKWEGKLGPGFSESTDLAREGVLEGEVIPPREPGTSAVTGPTPETALPDAPMADYMIDFYRRNYPEQMAGTFGSTQSPSTEGLLRGASGKVGRGWETATGALPRLTSKLAEENFRRGLIRTYIKDSPEFKAVYNSMPRESRSFVDAAEKLHKGEGGEAFQKMISQQVDQALGNYTRLSPIERNVLRNTFPFYAWYRAILSTSFYLAVDNPLRAQLLYRIGQIGAETALNQKGMLPLPSYLQGSIPLGEGPHRTKRVIATQTLNPWATLSQLQRGASEDLGELGLNPFVIGALEAFKKLASGPGGTTRGVSVQDLVGEMLTQIVRGLPPVAQVFPRGPSRLYPNRGYASTWEAWAGLPLKEYRPAVAAEYARGGQ